MNNPLDTLHDVLASPIGLVGVTVGAYQCGRWLQRRSGGHALVQPTLVAIVIVGVVLEVLGVRYADYADAATLVSIWLGPATVALAVPLHRQAHRLTGFVVPMLTAVVLGAVVSITTAALVAHATGADVRLQKTLATKSSTTPVAIAVAQHLGGIPALAAVFAIVIGVVGAVLGPAVLDLVGVHDRRARGLAIGAVSHGIGASRMLREDETEGAFAGLSMGLTALAISALVPLLALWLW
ncbi:MAG: LrgB family protein [Nocardioidaceae bacterium]|nr:LrgB family protein [Nocardioidaceae bacterium]MCL2614268.1 LrgB family protein [Nocardioidaceae bacterium]